jgi:phospholipase/carboxylesterase
MNGKHEKSIVQAGARLQSAKKALLLIHGRGGSAEDIMSLAHELDVKDFALIAPQATNHTWYPYSFLAPPSQNEPWLSSAIELLDEVVADINKAGITNENIYLLGFSQGACLALEYSTRRAQKWGGVIAFTGGLIGDKINRENYAGNFTDTPVYIGSSDVDPHVPVARVYASENIMKEMGANVEVQVFPGFGHTINREELVKANAILAK